MHRDVVCQPKEMIMDALVYYRCESPKSDGLLAKMRRMGQDIQLDLSLKS
mgnify:CR=1 FL=1